MHTSREGDSSLCPACVEGPVGEAGHVGLRHYVAGPFPGQNIYKCAECSDRWIRHYGGEPGQRAWTRFAEQFPSAIRRPITSPKRGMELPF